MTKTSVGVMLDLDDTLVISSAIEGLRRRGQWQECYQEFSRTHLPEGTHAFLGALRALAACGVVTTAPRTYAERLIAFHGLNIEVLVAYHDVTPHKPHPQPLLLGAQKLRISIDKCVYIGDNENDGLAAIRAGAKPISVCWTGNNCCDGSLGKWSEVLKQIEKFDRGTNGLG